MFDTNEVFCSGLCCYKSASPLQVFCSNPAAQLLSKSFSEGQPKPFSVKSVRAGDRLDIGGGISNPNVKRLLYRSYVVHA
jgi:hypothetical protein